MYALGAVPGAAFLAVEHLRLEPMDDAAAAALGRALAAQHRCQPPAAADAGAAEPRRYGWARSTMLGRGKQPRGWRATWADAFCDLRLAPQLEWAAQRGRPYRDAEAALARARAVLGSHRPPPALLHGDLWGGNAGAVACAADGQRRPVLYDPAPYYGDREADLAMTRLFGGFSPAFYAAYEAAWPLPEGHARRVSLYNLYHLLNHDNIFGGGYRQQAEAAMAHVLRL